MGKLTDRLDRPIVLVGLMGAGKSTVGRRLAKRLGLPFIDTDAAIADAAGLGTKLVSVVPGNAARGLSTHLGLIALFAPDTGALQAIMDARYITEVRTAAVSSVRW